MWEENCIEKETLVCSKKLFLSVSKMKTTMQILFLLKLLLIPRSTDGQKSLLCCLPNGDLFIFPILLLLLIKILLNGVTVPSPLLWIACLFTP